MTKILHTKVEIGSPLLASDITDLTFFPVGMIMLMDGSWQDGRGGWYICDGQSRTIPGLGAVTMPDLRDRFIRGGTSSGGVGGGTAILDTVNLPSHNHSLSGLTVTGGGAHSHGVGTLAAASGSATHSHGNGTLAVSVTGGTHGHAITDTGHRHPANRQHYTGQGNSCLSGGNETFNPAENNWWYSTGYAYTGISIATTTGTHEHTVVVSGATATDGAAHDHGITGSTEAGGSAVQVSGGTIGSTGSGTPFNVVPAYYTVIYIKKMV